MQVSDEEILKEFKDPATKEKAFNKLVNAYQERLYWHIRRIVLVHADADDVLQNVFVKIWKNLAKFQQNSKLYTWLYRIATNESLTFINSRKRKKTTPLETDDYDLKSMLSSDPFFDGDDLQIRLEEAIETLPDKQKIVFKLRYYEEMKYDEMSEVTGTSVGALKASYHHAVKKIEKYFSED